MKLPIEPNGEDRDQAIIPRRLALLLPDMGGGGAERVALALLDGFVAAGHEVDLVLLQSKGALIPLIPDAVRIIDLQAPRQRDSLQPLIAYLKEERPDALHAMMWPMPLYALLAKAIARADTRVVASEHNTYSIVPHGLRFAPVRLLTRLAYRNLKAIIAVSDGVADDLAEFVGIPRASITVIHNPIMLPARLPARLPDGGKAATRWTGGAYKLLAIGNLKPQKNFALLIRALKILRDKMDASLLILGEGAQREQLERVACEQGVQAFVVFEPFATDVWPYYGAADLFVLSSDHEGFGNVLIEAMHAGLPVVSTDCPNGPREILDHGKYGRLVPCRDADALAAAIEETLMEETDRAAAKARANDLSGSRAIEKHLRPMLTS